MLDQSKKEEDILLAKFRFIMLSNTARSSSSLPPLSTSVMRMLIQVTMTALSDKMEGTEESSEVRKEDDDRQGGRPGPAKEAR